MNNIVLRTPRLDEAETLAALGRETFVETFGHIYSSDNLSKFLNTSFGPGVQAAQLKDPNYAIQVAVQDSIFVGFIKVGANSLPFAAPERATGELKQLYMRKSCHGQGIAPLLMDWGMDWLRSHGYLDVLLSVYSVNPRAQRFYQRYGFLKLADHFFMVGDHRDEEYIFHAQLDRVLSPSNASKLINPATDK